MVASGAWKCVTCSSESKAEVGVDDDVVYEVVESAC